MVMTRSLETKFFTTENLNMKRIINIDTNISYSSDSEWMSKHTCNVTKEFDDKSKEVEEYILSEKLVIEKGDNVFSKSLVQNIILPNDLSPVSRIEFENCIFVNEVDLDFHSFKGDVVFKNCIFIGNFTILGDFYGYVSFEQSSFIHAKINFQECLFDSFNFRIVTLNQCDVCFQETEFGDESPVFSDVHLHNSSLRFMATVFPTSAKVLNFLAVEADYNSFIQFRMVDFDFREFRLFKAKISTLEFSDCTFNCNRFEWECECETLIIQGCRNFRIMNMVNLEGLKHLNIFGLLNTGKIILGDNVEYYLKALKTNKDILWVRAEEYRSMTLLELKNQLFVLKDFFSESQSRQVETVYNEIKVIEREEDMMAEQGLKMRIFLSYSWKDEKLADSIDSKFADSGITLIRDKRGIEYLGSVKEFMKKIRFNDYVVLIISPYYLKSANCMFEIAELTKDESYKTRILPVVKKNTGIFDPFGRNSYIVYWQDAYKKLYADSDMLEPLNRSGIISELLRYERIMRDLPVFLQNLSDMKVIECKNTINDDDFNEIMSVINSTSFQN